MAAFIRCAGLRNRVGLFSQPLHIARHVFAIPTIHTHRCLATNADRRERLLNSVNNRLDYKQGVSINLFEDLSSSLFQDGPLSEKESGLLLHICSNGPFDCPMSKRIELVDDVWSKFKERGVSLSVKLNNIKLKAYCANKKDFNPLDELLEMKTLGLIPDKVTYSLLIEAFCLKGDIDGANSVLEAMKEEKFTINEVVFNSFITGHLKAGSLEEAQNVLQLMRSSGLNPNAHSYFRLASYFAEKGDIESVYKYINEADEAGVPMDHYMLLDVYIVMVTSGDSAAASQFLQTVSEKGLLITPSLQKVSHLASEGFMDAALDLYLKMQSVYEAKSSPHSGSFLLKAMVINGYNAQDIFNTANKILENQPSALYVYRNALHTAYTANRTDLAMDLLDLMIAENHRIKVPYVTPAVCSYRNDGNTEGVYRAIKILFDLSGREIRDDRFDQLVRCCYPALVQCGESRQSIIDRFKNHESSWNSIFFVHDIDQEGFDEALSNAQGKNLHGWIFMWENIYMSINKHLPQQADACVKALDFIRQSPNVEQRSLCNVSGVAVRCMLNLKDWPAVEKMLDDLLKFELFLPSTLKNINFLNDAPQSVKDKMKTLCKGNNAGRRNLNKRESQNLHRMDLDEMSDEQLKQYQKKNPKIFLPRSVLLERAMESNDLEVIQQTLREIQALGFTLPVMLVLKVISKLVRLKDTETAMICFEELKKHKGDSYPPTIPLKIAEKLFKQGNVEDTLKMLQEAKRSTSTINTTTKHVMKNILCFLFENSQSIEVAESIHTTIYEAEPLLKDSFAVHTAYVKRILDLTDDDNELVDRLHNIYRTYHVFPAIDLVLLRLIQNKDVENLKKVMELSTTAFGSNFAHHKLALGFIKSGMPSKGATVLNTPGLYLNEKLLDTNCRYLIQRKEIAHLESLVKVLKDMPVSQTNLLKRLVEGYVSVGKVQEATEAVEQFSVDVMEPSKETVLFLVNAYGTKGLTIPESLNVLASKHNKVESSSSSSDDSSDSDGPPSETVETEQLSETDSKS